MMTGAGAAEAHEQVEAADAAAPAHEPGVDEALELPGAVSTSKTMQDRLPSPGQTGSEQEPEQ
jgi:hypothetical protein